MVAGGQCVIAGGKCCGMVVESVEVVVHKDTAKETCGGNRLLQLQVWRQRSGSAAENRKK